MSKRRKPSKFVSLLGTLLLVGCIAALYIYMPVGISKENVEKHLQMFSAFVTKQATDNGKEGKFTYAGVTTEGWGYEQRAVIASPNIQVNDQVAGSQWQISTPTAIATPDYSPDKLFFSIPGSVNVLQNGEGKYTITFSAPPKYSYYDGNKTGTHTVEHDFILPSQITVTPAKTTDESGKKISPMVIAYDGTPVLRTTTQPEAGTRTTLAEFSNLRISNEEGDLMVVTSLMSRYSDKQTPDKRLEGTYSLMMTDLLLRQPNGLMKPYSFSGDFKFATVPPAPLAPDAPEGTPPNKPSTDITINKLHLITSEFEIKADGKVSAAQDDPLLSGEANIEIKNAGNLIASDMVPVEIKPILESALLKISGQAIDATTTVSFPVKREKNGTLYLGTLTFEELTAAIFADVLGNQPTVTTLPESPPAGAPGAAPVSPVATTPPPAVNLGILPKPKPPAPPVPPAPPAEKKK